ncbi:MAG TPA: transglutaminase family protein [Vicinamibacterales bacterium]|nr:transglutaminase family protein [Vicinamibacterales bacterium]
MRRRNASRLEYARPSFPAGRPLLEAVADLTTRVHADFTFDTEATTVTTSLSEVFRLRRGVCQDFTRFEIACLRSVGVPALYMSGFSKQRRLRGCRGEWAPMPRMRG